MDWWSEREWRAMERLYPLLLSLARLADRAGHLPMLLRLPVLAILGYGEAVARDFVMATAFGGPGRPDGAASLAAGDAGRLATSFRALALVLGFMLAGAPLAPRFPAGAPRPFGDRPAPLRRPVLACGRPVSVSSGPDPPLAAKTRKTSHRQVAHAT